MTIRYNHLGKKCTKHPHCQECDAIIWQNKGCTAEVTLVPVVTLKMDGSVQAGVSQKAHLWCRKHAKAALNYQI